jgi:pteridine reductase
MTDSEKKGLAYEQLVTKSWLNGKVVILTGGKRMGAAVAARLKIYGATVVGTYRESAEPVKAFSDLAVQANLSQEGDVANLIHTTMTTYRRIDAVIHGAAPYIRVEWENMKFKTWHDDMAAIADSTFLLFKAAVDEMLENDPDDDGIRGKLVSVSDWAVEAPYPEYTSYFAAKMAGEMITRDIARNFGARGILANIIRPGPMILPPDLPREEEIEALAGTPLGRWSGPEPLAEQICSTLNNRSQTGAIITVDGGRSIW